MTPDEARNLADSFEGRRLAADCETYGLADGYQHTEHYVLLEIDGEHPETGEPDVWADTLGMPDKATADMIAAAPTLAAMIAGMHTEYAVRLPDGQLVGAGWGTHDTALEDQNAWRRDGYDARLVRRYVTEPEEA